MIWIVIRNKKRGDWIRFDKRKGDKREKARRRSNEPFLSLSFKRKSSNFPIISSLSWPFSRHANVQASLTLVIWLNENVGFRLLFWKNVANYALFSRFIWLFDINLVSLPQNLRRYKCYFVAQSTNALCIYTKELIGRTSVGTRPKFHSFKRKYSVSRGCFMAG